MPYDQHCVAYILSTKSLWDVLGNSQESSPCCSEHFDKLTLLNSLHHNHTLFCSYWFMSVPFSIAGWHSYGFATQQDGINRLIGQHQVAKMSQKHLLWNLV